MDPLLRNPLNCWLCLSCAAPGTASPLCLCEIHSVFGGKHKPWHFVENWLLRTLSWQVGFMKNGKVKSLEVSYYSNGGNSADLSHGVSKIFWWLNSRRCFSVQPSALTSETFCLQHCLHMQLFDMTENRFWRDFGASTNALWANWLALACAT